MHVGVEAWIRQRREVDRDRPLRPLDPKPPLPLLNVASGVLELAELHAKRLRLAAGHGHVASGDGGRDGIGAGFETVRDHVVVGGLQRVHPGDVHDGRATTADHSSHLLQLGDEVLDLGLSGGVHDHRLTLGEDACE